MALSLRNVTFDCADPKALAAFWSEVIDKPVADYSNDEFAAVGMGEAGEVGMLFLRVPEPKTAKNRFHPDLTAKDREAEIERLVTLGATRGSDHEMKQIGAVWTVMQDPEGNEFCVAQR